jgi:hypothetical protein
MMCMGQTRTLRLSGRSLGRRSLGEGDLLPPPVTRSTRIVS